jgi:cytoskeleton protein RodZ
MFEIGSSLREARLRQGLDFPELEQATKIRGKYLRALEDEEFDVLPAQTYVKGFLRGYAEYLGLDGQLYVDEFNSRYVTGEEEPLLRSRHRVSPQRRRTVESRAVVLTLLGIAAVAALVIVAWKNSGTPRQNIPDLSTKKPATAPPRQKTHARAARRAPVRIVFRALHETSALEVRWGGPGGSPVYAGTLVPGQPVVKRGRKLWLQTSTPGNVAITLNRRRVVRLPAGGPSTYVVTPRGVRAASRR